MNVKQEARKPGGLRDELSESVIGAAIRVHRELGPGFLESVYEEALAVEFIEKGTRFERQKPVRILYREHTVGEHRLDYLVENTLVLELKAVASLDKVHFAIVRSYLKAANLSHALLLNFSGPTLEIKRIGRDFTGARPRINLHE
jgi:GxxExxY protein